MIYLFLILMISSVLDVKGASFNDGKRICDQSAILEKVMNVK